MQSGVEGSSVLYLVLYVGTFERMDGGSTPNQGVSKNIMRITANQKQALMDNLQLEGSLRKYPRPRPGLTGEQ